MAGERGGGEGDGHESGGREDGGGRLAALVAALTDALGPARVSTAPAARRAASRDWAHLSPVLAARLPAGLADVVAYPRTPEDVAGAVALAYAHRVPVTPRGRGTGNYGQAIPLAGGLVVDTSRCDRVLEVGDGWLRAEAGASFVAMEAAARRTGQELAIMPSTVGSTVGGFVAGGAGGIGSIENGWIWEGYVRAVAAVPCTGVAEPLELTGAECAPLIHAYGVTGLIAAVTVALVPARDWTALLASCATEADAVAAGRALMRLDPPPRGVCVDEPGLVATFPPDEGMPAGRFSVRAIVDRSTLPAAEAVVRQAGRLEAVRPREAAYLTSLSFNHVTYRARRARPELCHLQVGGDAVIRRAAEIREAVPGALLHLDGFRTAPGVRGFAGLLLAPFRGTEALYADMARLTDLGVQVTDPHTWLLSYGLEPIRVAAGRYDPRRLLNPGKLPGR